MATKTNSHSQTSKTKRTSKDGENEPQVGMVYFNFSKGLPGTNDRIDLHSGATKQNHQQSARPGNQRAKVPSTTNGKLWHSNSCKIQHVHCRKASGHETNRNGPDWHDGAIDSKTEILILSSWELQSSLGPLAILSLIPLYGGAMGRPSWLYSSQQGMYYFLIIT